MRPPSSPSDVRLGSSLTEPHVLALAHPQLQRFHSSSGLEPSLPQTLAGEKAEVASVLLNPTSTQQCRSTPSIKHLPKTQPGKQSARLMESSHSLVRANSSARPTSFRVKQHQAPISLRQFVVASSLSPVFSAVWPCWFCGSDPRLL